MDFHQRQKMEERQRNEQAFFREAERRERMAREEQSARREREEMLASMTTAQREAFLDGERRCDLRWSAVSSMLLIAGLFALLYFITPESAVTPGSILFFAAGSGLVLYSLSREEPWDHRWKRRAGYLLIMLGVLAVTGILRWFPDSKASAHRVSSMSQALLKTALQSMSTWQVGLGDVHV